MSIFKKVTAMICGATTLLAMAATMSVSAADAVFKADQVTCESGETVSFSIRLENNPGYCPSGLRLDYNVKEDGSALDEGAPKLEPVGKNGTDMEYTTGPAVAGLSPMLTHATSKDRLAWSTSGSADNKNDGIVYTVKFKVPEVEEETTFPMLLSVKVFSNEADNPPTIPNTAENGWIKVLPKAAETTTTEAPETTTQAPATTTEEKQIETSTEAISTTAEEVETGTTTEATSDNGNEGTKDTNNGNDQPGPKAGDASVGLAVAALLAAAGAAVVVRRKHD